MRKVFMIILISLLLVGCSSKSNDELRDVGITKNYGLPDDGFDVIENPTRYIYEEPSLETNDVYNETYANVINEYTETVSYVDRYPDTELPDMEGFKKDAYGNYVITEQMFIDKVLPINKDGVIEYISYFDENGIMVNPMPTYYNNYLQYFASYGG